MIALRPTESYELTLPDDVLQELDEGVSSFWRAHSGTALQLSSRLRSSGTQVNAQQRLNDRMEMNQGLSTWVTLDGFRADWCPDVAAATCTKSNGWVWTHAYLVWPDLAVYATVSRPPNEDTKTDEWAIQAVKSIRRTSDN